MSFEYDGARYVGYIQGTTLSRLKAGACTWWIAKSFTWALSELNRSGIVRTLRSSYLLFKK